MNQERAVQQVLARYVRATDSRNGAAMSALFTDDGVVQICVGEAGVPAPIAELHGAQAIGGAVSGLMAPHPPRGWSHHTTHDPIIEVSGETATLDAQFIVFKTHGHDKPADGWPQGALGAQGVITPIEAGYYRSSLVKLDGNWKIRHHQIILDLPVAFPRG